MFWLAMTLVGCSEYELIELNTPTRIDRLFDELFDEPIPPAEEPIYLNEPDALWSWDPDDNELTFIGGFTDAFGLLNGMTDIAINNDGQMLGCASDTLYAINPETAEVAEIGPVLDENGLMLGLTGLTFVGDDALVGAGPGLRELDPITGETLQVLPGTGLYSTSGDVVGLPDEQLYWSVTHGGDDEIIVVNPESGQIGSLGSSSVERLYGMGYYDETLYGFTEAGDWLELNVSDGDRARWGQLVTWGATTNPVRWSRSL
ncbi:MAG: hypothetical protein AAFV53_39235 [Myxococcota bacterium]